MINSRMLFGPFGLSVAAAVVVVIALVAPIPRVLGVLSATSSEGQDNAARIVELVAQSEQQLDLNKERFLGRSAFFTPPRPYYEPPPRVERNDEPQQPRILPAPVSYGGSLKPFAIVGDQVWFATSESSSSQTMLRIGERASDIRLLAINAPWTVRVAWKGANTEEGEYDLRVFSATDSSGFRSTPPSSSAMPPGMRSVPAPEPSSPPVDTTNDPVDERAIDDVPPPSDDEESRS